MTWGWKHLCDEKAKCVFSLSPLTEMTFRNKLVQMGGTQLSSVGRKLISICLLKTVCQISIFMKHNN